jgi:membrane protease YdiL (CAAX protease family)
VVLWFGLAHAFQLAGDWIALPVILGMGVVWTWQRHRYGSLTLPLITHWGYNVALVTPGALYHLSGAAV